MSWKRNFYGKNGSIVFGWGVVVFVPTQGILSTRFLLTVDNPHTIQTHTHIQPTNICSMGRDN